jgi:hypothetical protein
MLILLLLYYYILLIYSANQYLHFISKSEIVGDEFCRVFCPGKLTAAENLHVLTDSLKLFPSLQHHIAALVLSQEVRWYRTSVVDLDPH